MSGHVTGAPHRPQDMPWESQTTGQVAEHHTPPPPVIANEARTVARQADKRDHRSANSGTALQSPKRHPLTHKHTHNTHSTQADSRLVTSEAEGRASFR